jgi:DNA-binding response OmpR family regulator
MSESSSTSTTHLPTILVVEDDLAMADVVQRILSSQGCRVQVANIAAYALDLLEQGQPDLILLDVMLPEMDGFELLLEMQKRYPVSPDSVIMMSGLTEQKYIDQAYEAGVFAYLKKPFTPDELIAVVADRFISRKNGESLER